MKKYLVATFLMLFGLAGMAQDNKKPAGEENLVNAVAWMQHSGEYRALCYQAFRIGQMRLDEILATDKSEKPKAIVLDIDETVLDNSPLEAYMAIHGKKESGKNWSEWIKMACAEPLAGAVDFLNNAKEHGVTIFYISNRGESKMVPTVENLKKFNFPFADDQHVILQKKDFNKESRRAEVAKNYNIILFFGDNLNDFSDLFYMQHPDKSAASLVDENKALFGQKFIILPNAMYGSWTRELGKPFKGQKLPSKEIKMRSLKPYKQ